MKPFCSVFRIQFTMFRKDRGMLFFYFLCLAASGLIPPIFFRNTEWVLILAGSFSITFLKPLLSDSVAGERERKTLESLLSTSVNGSAVIWGKAAFSLVFAAAYFSMVLICSEAAGYFMGLVGGLMAWQWFFIVSTIFLSFAVMSAAGTYLSAVSPDSRIAGLRISRIVYPAGLLNIVFLTVVSLAQFLPAAGTCLLLSTIYLTAFLVYTLKISRMKQPDYFSHMEENAHRASKNSGSEVLLHRSARTAPRSPFTIVLHHEWKYLLTLKKLLRSLLLLCLCPIPVLCLLNYYTGETNLYYGILVILLFIPRATTNMVSYSIGGEKAYKTGESLLSTPLGLKPLFLAKCTLPVLISAVLLLFSSLLLLLGANLIGILFESGAVCRYTPDQLVLLFPVGIMAAAAMVFITGILSVSLQTPRQGLWVSSIITYLFVLPPLPIVYLAPNPLKWSLFYFILLVLFNAFCLKIIFTKAKRPFIMSRL